MARNFATLGLVGVFSSNVLAEMTGGQCANQHGGSRKDESPQLLNVKLDLNLNETLSSAFSDNSTHSTNTTTTCCPPTTSTTATTCAVPHPPNCSSSRLTDGEAAECFAREWDAMDDTMEHTMNRYGDTLSVSLATELSAAWAKVQDAVGMEATASSWREILANGDDSKWSAATLLKELEKLAADPGLLRGPFVPVEDGDWNGPDDEAAEEENVDWAGADSDATPFMDTL